MRSIRLTITQCKSFRLHWKLYSSMSDKSGGEPIVVYTDGSYRKKYNTCGIGVYFPENRLFPSLQFSEDVKHHKLTNQVAELKACIKAIEMANDKNVKKLIIRTDSEYIVKSMKHWIHDWKINNWKKTGKNADVENRDLMETLDKLCQTLHVTWEHIPREENKVANDLAQKLTKPTKTSQ